MPNSQCYLRDNELTSINECYVKGERRSKSPKNKESNLKRKINEIFDINCVHNTNEEIKASISFSKIMSIKVSLNRLEDETEPQTIKSIPCK